MKKENNMAQKHRRKEIKEEPFKDWEIKEYNDKKQTNENSETHVKSEIETDRDLDKTTEQLLYDVFDGYFVWTQKSNLIGEQLSKDPTRLMLYTLTKTASMNAKISKVMEKLTKQILCFTIATFAFTAILVFFAIRGELNERQKGIKHNLIQIQQLSKMDSLINVMQSNINNNSGKKELPNKKEP